MFTSPISGEQVYWKSGYFRVFITHISRHKQAAAKLQASLLHHQISSFVAHSDIQPTREWENEILSALRSADALIALLHKGFHDSHWTDQEIGIAIGRDLLALSISFSETPYGFIGRYQALRGRGKSYSRLAEEAFRIFLTHPQSRRKIAEALVNRFSESDTFEQAKRHMTLLESVEYWDDRLSKAARDAVERNSQISDAWGVSHRVESLIRKWKSDEIPF